MSFKTVLLILSGLLVAATVGAATPSISQGLFFAPSSTIVVKGYRFGASLINHDISDGIGSTDFDASTGLFFGYEEIRSAGFGYFVQASNTAYKINDIASGSVTRLDLNATYPVIDKVYLYGGINLSKLNGELGLKQKSEAGVQFGAGYQFKEKIAFEMSYSTVNLISIDPSIQASGDIGGIEFSIIGLFN